MKRNQVSTLQIQNNLQIKPHIESAFFNTTKLIKLAHSIGLVMLWCRLTHSYHDTQSEYDVGGVDILCET